MGSSGELLAASGTDPTIVTLAAGKTLISNRRHLIVGRLCETAYELALRQAVLDLIIRVALLAHTTVEI